MIWKSAFRKLSSSISLNRKTFSVVLMDMANIGKHKQNLIINSVWQFYVYVFCSYINLLILITYTKNILIIIAILNAITIPPIN